MKMGPKKHPQQTYWDQIRDKAAWLGTDGCTWATSAFKDCCLEHDVHCRTGERLDGTPISIAESHEQFLACMRSKSLLGYYSPIAIARYWIVKKLYKPKRKAKRDVEKAREVGRL
jgi:hypothetical protein